MTKNIEFELKVATRYKRLHEGAKRRNKIFEITLADMRRLLKQKKCSYTGIDLTDDDTSDNCPTHRTFERIDPRIGYTKENTIVVCRIANKLKETLLESKYTSNDGTNPNCVGITFMKKFVDGVLEQGYTDPDDVFDY